MTSKAVGTLGGSEEPPVSIPPASALIFDKGIVRRALATSAIVGTILNLIAQGDLLFAGEPIKLWKILLTYVVPYCVATYGGVTAQRALLRKLRQKTKAEVRT